MGRWVGEFWVGICNISDNARKYGLKRGKVIFIHLRSLPDRFCLV